MTNTIPQEAAPERETTPPALEVRGMTGGYGKTTVLRDVSLTVAPASVTALLGPNGAGKTTLLKMIAGLLQPVQGDIVLAGEVITKVRPAQRDRRGLCLIPEGRGIFRSMSVRENLRLQSKKGHEDEAIERAMEAFPVIGKRLSQLAGTLSGGEQQMLAMSRAYIRNPSLILVDEGSLGLAPVLVDEIFAFLRKLATDGVALLIVDQFVNMALDMADTAYVLSRGEVSFAGSADELRSEDLFNKYLGGD